MELTDLQKDRFYGCLIGLAVGDALGTTNEFKKRGSFQPITDIVGGGHFDLKPGEWTDDTSMALCLMESLTLRGFDPKDQLERYWRWYEEGYYSSTGECFDIGSATREALDRFRRTNEPYCGSTNPERAGNGCIMRLAPIPMYYMDDLAATIKYSELSCRTTHQAPACIEASKFFGYLLHKALNGYRRTAILNYNQDFELAESPVAKVMQDIIDGKYYDKSENEISSDGYVINSLEAALWCFSKTSSFSEAVLKAANLGDDSDTVAAICGQLAGAYYGAHNIPNHWKTCLAKEGMISYLLCNMREEIERILPEENTVYKN